uniref:Peptidase C14 caspase domain-containing protein n=1 Tax=Noctiluca scintillans TaxID=2966 RepID=A0A7S1ADE4_NOCSC
MGNVFQECMKVNSGRDHDRVPYVKYSAPVGVQEASRVGGSPPRVTGRKRALLIGINYVGTSAQLRGCINDVDQMRQFLIRELQFPDSQVRVLKDESGWQWKPTRANIIKQVEWLVGSARPGDVFFFHFSGHGGQQEDPSYAEEDAMDETILPSDFQQSGQIVDDELFDRMVAPLPNGCKLTCLMDCCHSGTGLDLPFTFDGRWREDDNPCHSEAHVLNLSGCCDDQTSADAQNFAGSPGGAMTTALLETLRRNPAPTHTQLLTEIRRNLRSNGFSQNPQLTSSQRFDAAGEVFQICDGIVPNQNHTIGRHFRKRKHRKADWLNSDDGIGLGPLLFADVATDMMFGFGGGGGFFGDGGGGFFGDGGGDLFGDGGGGLFGDGGGGLFGDGGGGGDFFGD